MSNNKESAARSRVCPYCQREEGEAHHTDCHLMRRGKSVFGRSGCDAADTDALYVCSCGDFWQSHHPDCPSRKQYEQQAAALRAARERIAELESRNLGLNRACTDLHTAHDKAEAALAAEKARNCGCVWRPGIDDRGRGDRPFYACPHHQQLYCDVDSSKRALATEKVRGERMREFVDRVAGGYCHYGDGCPKSAMRLHGQCFPCAARAALADEDKDK